MRKVRHVQVRHGQIHAEPVARSAGYLEYLPEWLARDPFAGLRMRVHPRLRHDRGTSCCGPPGFQGEGWGWYCTCAVQLLKKGFQLENRGAVPAIFARRFFLVSFRVLSARRRSTAASRTSRRNQPSMA